METHQGNMIIHAAERYPTLLEVILELVQNGLDVVGANHVWVTINKRTRRISVADNGSGTDQMHFELALRSVGRTLKSSDKMGRFGLGMVSPIGKCEHHTFTSTPKSDPRKYLKWTFVAEDIASQDLPQIPFESDPKLMYSSQEQGKSNKVLQAVNWRTKVDIYNYTADRFVSRLTMEILAEQIRSRFNVSMLKDKSIVHLTIKDENGEHHMDIDPIEFQGVPLPEASVKDRDTTTQFRLFLAKKTSKGRSGIVSVGERYNDFRIPFKTFIKNVPEGIRISNEAISALTSGVFEGEILNNRVRVASSRRCFEENENLTDFCVAIDQWFKQVGSVHFEETRDVESAERYQDLSRRTLQVFKGLRETQAGQWINDMISRFKFGTQGVNHTENVNSSKELPGKAISVTKPVLVSREPTGEDPGTHKRTPKVEIGGHSPTFVTGPKGTKRRIVRDDSLGISIANEPLGGSDLWVFDDKVGMVTFNTEHPLWAECDDRGEKILGRFQEYLFIRACFVQSLHGRDFQEMVRLLEHEIAASYVFTLCNGDMLAERTPIRKAHEARRKISADRKKESLKFRQAR